MRWQMGHLGLLLSTKPAVDLSIDSYLVSLALSRLLHQDEMVITTRGPGQYIGEVHFFNDDNHRSVWRTGVRARSNVTCLLLCQRAVQQQLRNHPEIEIEVRSGELVICHPVGTLLSPSSKLTMITLLGQLSSNFAGTNEASNPILRGRSGCCWCTNATNTWEYSL